MAQYNYTQAQLIALVNQAAANNPPAQASTMLILLGMESSLNANVGTSSAGAQGIAQITSATWSTAQSYPGAPQVPYTTDPAVQITMMAAIDAKYEAAYNGDIGLVAAAYIAGPGVANQAQAAMQANPSLTSVQAVAQVYSGPQTNAYVANAVNQSGGAVQSTTQNPTNQPDPYSVDGANPPTALAVSGTQYTPAQAAALLAATTPALIVQSGLDEVAWFADSNILQVNGATGSTPSPINFSIYYDQGMTRLPVNIQLNASLKSRELGMKHVINHRPSRTGQLISLWGAEMDTLSGQATTGVFMNQMGLTDFLSISNPSNSVLAPLIANLSQDQDDSATMNEGTFRIAAKDAFIEFLSMFKNNGIVWYHNAAYNGSLSSLNQSGPDAWSPTTGSSTFQNNARNNDVQTRGQVTMTFRDSTYAGFFKSLSWSMDAANPFQWSFNFVFQVERTNRVLPVFNAAVASQSSPSTVAPTNTSQIGQATLTPFTGVAS
jgi:hypothetical protein